MAEKGGRKQQTSRNDRTPQEDVNSWKKTVFVRDVFKPSHCVDRTQGSAILGPAKVATHGRPVTGGGKDRDPAGHAQQPGKAPVGWLWIGRGIGHRRRSFAEADVTFPSLQVARLLWTLSLRRPD